MDRGTISVTFTQSLVPLLKGSSGLNLSSSEAGALGSLFMLGYITASPLSGLLAQYIHATYVIAIGLGIWLLANILAATSTGFWQLAVARSLTGAGEAALIALVPAYLITIAPEQRKTNWMAIFFVSANIGFAIGYVFVVIVLQIVDDWYWPFYIQAIIISPFCLGCIIMWKDPNFIKKSEEGNLPLWEQYKALISNPSYMLIVLGYAALMFYGGGLAFWSPDYLNEHFGMQMSIEAVVLGGTSIFSGVVGMFCGSTILDRIFRKISSLYSIQDINSQEYSKLRVSYVSKFIFFCAIAAYITGIVPQAIDQVILFIVGVAFTITFLNFTIGPISIGVMSSVPEELRGQANALQFFFIHLLGDFPSPYLIGVGFDYIGMYWAIFILFNWIVFGIIAWFLAWNYSRFYGEKTFWQSIASMCRKNPGLKTFLDIPVDEKDKISLFPYKSMEDKLI